MPLKAYDTKQAFDDEYDLGAENGHPNTRPEVRLKYNRAVLFSEAQVRAAKFIELLNIQTTDTVLILGAGFGWTVEAMEQAGIVDVVGVDTSPYINAAATSTEEADIDNAITAVGLDPTVGEGATIKATLFDGGNISRTSKGIKNEDLNSGQSRNRLRQALGNQPPDIAITEHLIESLTDQEVTDLTARVTAFAPAIRIAHFVITTNVSDRTDLNMKTLDQWKLLLPTATIIEEGTWRII